MKKYGLHCSKPQRYLKITSFPGRLVLASVLAFAHFLTGGATAATISFVGVEQSTAPAYAVQNWSSPSSPKTFDLGGSEVYGTAGYYQIRPTPNSSPTGVNEAAGAGNNLGVTAVTNPTLSSAPVMLSAITGDAGTFVNYGGYPTFLGPDGSTVYRQGSLSLAVVNGPCDTPSGANSGFFGEAFNFTVGMSATCRVGITVDTVSDGPYAPDYVSIYNSSTGTVFSAALTRNGVPDMAVFELDATAGDSFTAAVWQTNGSQSVAPFGLITFDVVRYNFEVSSGQIQTNSVALGGAPAGLLKTGEGTLVLASSNSCAGGTLVSAGTLSIPQGGSIGGNITNNGRLVIAADLVNPVAGTGALVKTTIGNAVLWSSNSYTGATEVEAGQLRLDGAGAISPASTVYVASGASFSATGDFLLTNNLSISGLTGEGEFYSANGTLTVNKASGTNTFSGRIAGNTGLTKSGDGTFVLSGSNSYTGPTAINAGRVVVANGSALGSTSGGTVVAGDAQLRLNATNTGFAIGAEALTVSGQGLIGSAGGALRNAAGANTYQGKITLAADAGIGAASGTLLILDVASGDAIDLASFNLTIDGAGSTQVNDGIAGTGGIAKIGSGTITLAGNNTYTGATTVDLGALVVSNTSLSATISPTSVIVDFASPPVTGSTYTVLSGALATNSFVLTPVVNGLGSGQTATVTNNPNLVVLVSGSPASNNYASWLANYPSLTGADTNGSADPDGDGFINNTEFAFDGNPTVGTPALMTATAVGTNAVFNWIERTNGVTYEVQKNSSLTNPWTSTGIIGVVASNQSGVLLPPEYVRKQFSTNASGKDFYRVRATIP